MIHIKEGEMARRSARMGLMPSEIAAGVDKLDAAHNFLTKVAAAYPIKFDPDTPFGAADKAPKAILEAKAVLTEEREVTDRLIDSKPS